jgi:hypothetical protein
MVLAHGLLKERISEEDTVIEPAKFSFDDHVSFDARWMQLEIPLNVIARQPIPRTDKLHSEFEDHRVQDERNTPQIDWPFLTFWVSYAVGTVFIAVWALN